MEVISRGNPSSDLSRGLSILLRCGLWSWDLMNPSPLQLN